MVFVLMVLGGCIAAANVWAMTALVTTNRKLTSQLQDEARLAGEALAALELAASTVSDVETERYLRTVAAGLRPTRYLN
jgi:hypothetical protein